MCQSTAPYENLASSQNKESSVYPNFNPASPREIDEVIVQRGDARAALDTIIGESQNVCHVDLLLNQIWW